MNERPYTRMNAQRGTVTVPRVRSSEGFSADVRFEETVFLEGEEGFELSSLKKRRPTPIWRPICALPIHGVRPSPMVAGSMAFRR
jgi:hypothetical protein